MIDLFLVCASVAMLCISVMCIAVAYQILFRGL